MTVGGHHLRTLLIATAVVVSLQAFAEAGFVGSRTLEPFTRPAAGAKAVKVETKSTCSPAWLDNIVRVAMHESDTSSDGMSGTSAPPTTGQLSAITTARLSIVDDSVDSIALPDCPLHTPPDLGGLSPPPRG